LRYVVSMEGVSRDENKVVAEEYIYRENCWERGGVVCSLAKGDELRDNGCLVDITLCGSAELASYVIAYNDCDVIS
jgi:hypothetical protein